MRFWNKNILFGSFFVTFFLLLVSSATAQQNNDEATFRKALHFADSVYALQDYEGAKAAYQYAARFQNSTYIQQQLVTIDRKIAEVEALNKKYNGVISEARQALNAADLPKAKERLEYAMTLKPNEIWATEKLAEVNKTLSERAELQRQFDECITKGDHFFTTEKYADAKTEYEAALKLIPASTLAKEKITTVKAKIQDIDTEYKKQIASGDALYRENELEEAKTAYQAALKLKPEQPYPQQRIDQINSIIYAEAALAAELDVVVKAADQAFDNQNYTLATKKYNEALDILSSHTHSRERLQEIRRLIGENESKQLAYNAAIEKANAHFNQKRYPEAKSEYQSALNIYPNESFPKERITQINAILHDEESLQQNYDALIADADVAFNAKNWETAIKKYTEASELKPAENYPKQQLVKANKEYQAQLDLNKRYNEAITRADGLFNNQQWNESITAYQAASKVKPDETYPADQIAIAKGKMGDLAQLESNYKTAIAEADALFKSKSWSESIVKYQGALALKPSETYPQQQIDKANAEIDAMATKEAERIAAIQKSYDEAITRADGLFNNQQFSESITAYQAALKAKPDETYPADQIAIATVKMGDLAQLESNYKTAIAEADALFKSKSWGESIVKYQGALALKPSEAYPQQQIDKANAEIDAMATKEAERIAAIQKSYDEAITRADGLFNNQQFSESITAYQAALKAKPDETYPADQIAIATVKMGDLAQLESNYKTAITEADALFKAKSWSEAIVKYQGALALKPSETYPQQQIDKANAEIDAMATKEAERIAAIQKSYDDFITRGDDLFQKEDWQGAKTAFQQAANVLPDETYPVQKITAIDKILADILLDAEKAAENMRIYRDKVAEANGFINDKNYQSAVNTLKSALNYKPNDDFATKKIAELQKIIDDAAFAKSEYARLIAEGDNAFSAEKYRDAIAAYRASMRHQPNEMYPRKRISDAERNMEFTPERRLQLAKESLQRGEDAVKTTSYEAAMRAFGNAYYWYPEEGEATRGKIISIISTLEAGTEKNLLEEPMDLTSNRRGTIELDVKPSEIRGTAYILFKISGNYENNVNVFLRWGRLGNEHGSTVVTLVYGLDDIYYC
ncbi:MAG: hypothetical protein FWF09_03385, partial [Bacteroidales bacterium]|nr:hypothetical protein [Bacteroidales bacterium]